MLAMGLRTVYGSHSYSICPRSDAETFTVMASCWLWGYAQSVCRIFSDGLSAGVWCCHASFCGDSPVLEAHLGGIMLMMGGGTIPPKN